MAPTKAHFSGLWNWVADTLFSEISRQHFGLCFNCLNVEGEEEEEEEEDQGCWRRDQYVVSKRRQPNTQWRSDIPQENGYLAHSAAKTWKLP